MKKTLTIKEVVYTPKPVEVDIVETIDEHLIPITEKINSIEVLLNEEKLTEDCESINVLVEKTAFKNLFGKDAKPRKGDILSITGLQKQFKVKGKEKYKAKKKGKGYKLSLKSV